MKGYHSQFEKYFPTSWYACWPILSPSLSSFPLSLYLCSPNLDLSCPTQPPEWRHEWLTSDTSQWKTVFRRFRWVWGSSNHITAGYRAETQRSWQRAELVRGQEARKKTGRGITSGPGEAARGPAWPQQWDWGRRPGALCKQVHEAGTGNQGRCSLSCLTVSFSLMWARSPGDDLEQTGAQDSLKIMNNGK